MSDDVMTYNQMRFECGQITGELIKKHPLLVHPFEGGSRLAADINHALASAWLAGANAALKSVQHDMRKCHVLEVK